MSAHNALLLATPAAPAAADLRDHAALADRPALLGPIAPAGPIPLFENGRLIGLADHLAAADAWFARWYAALDAPR